MATEPTPPENCGCPDTTPISLDQIAINAEQLHQALKDGSSPNLPDIDFDSLVLPENILENLTKKLNPVEFDTLTVRKVGGSGVFDGIVESITVHMKSLIKDGYMDKSKFTEVFVQLFPAMLSESVRFTLEKDQTYWQAIQAQLAAQTQRVTFETAKMQLAEAFLRAKQQEIDWVKAKVDSLRASTEYAHAQHRYEYDAPLETCLLQLRVSNQDTQNDLLEHELTQMRPLQVEQLGLQRDGMELSNEGQMLQNDHNRLAMPVQRLILGLQRDNQALVNEGQTLSNQQADYTLQNLMPQQLLLVTEQTETQRASTSDVRLDGSPVMGAIGKQKELQTQQIESYQHDGRVKTASIWSNAWVAQKGIDPELLPPSQLQNASVDLVLTALRTGNNM